MKVLPKPTVQLSLPKTARTGLCIHLSIAELLYDVLIGHHRQTLGLCLPGCAVRCHIKYPSTIYTCQHNAIFKLLCYIHPSSMFKGRKSHENRNTQSMVTGNIML